jgi:hypothetical protein
MTGSSGLRISGARRSTAIFFRPSVGPKLRPGLQPRHSPSLTAESLDTCKAS